MPDSAKGVRAADPARLLHQIRWVTRLSVALTSAPRVDDVLSVLASGLISPAGLGYSRVVAFEANPRTRTLHGRFLLEVASREEMEDLREEMAHELAYLERRIEDFQPDPDTGEAVDQYRTLRLSSQWVTVYQRLGADGELSQRVARMEVHLADAAARSSSIGRAFSRSEPLAVRLGEEAGAIPAELADLLHEEVALVPLHTKKGLRGLIIADRRVTGEPIVEDDIESLDWFATQGALAIQNAELIHELEQAYDELKAVDSMKSNFLATVSHELRTPLTAISGFVELILNRKAGEVSKLQQDLLSRVAKNAGHLGAIVNDLIDIAELEAGDLSDVEPEPVDALEALFATIPKLEQRRRARAVRIEPIVPEVLPRVSADPRCLERVLFHLIDNAVKFSPDSDQVEVVFRPAGESHLEIDIVDHGVGIPADKLQKIFDQFYQVDSSSTRNFEGLGLGLSVSQMLVRKMGATIKVRSVVGEGSTFTIRLRLCEDEGPAPLDGGAGPDY